MAVRWFPQFGLLLITYLDIKLYAIEGDEPFENHDGGSQKVYSIGCKTARPFRIQWITDHLMDFTFFLTGINVHSEFEYEIALDDIFSAHARELFIQSIIFSQSSLRKDSPGQ
jgi:hypothetical protein